MTGYNKARLAKCLQEWYDMQIRILGMVGKENSLTDRCAGIIHCVADVAETMDIKIEGIENYEWLDG